MPKPKKPKTPPKFKPFKPAISAVPVDKEVEDFAGVLYTTYCDAVGWVAWNGDSLPEWDVFRDDPEKSAQSEAWIRVAEKAEEILGSDVPS